MVLAKLLFETSLIESGFHPEDTKAFSQRVYELAKGAIGVTESLDAIEEVRAFTALQMAFGDAWSSCGEVPLLPVFCSSWCRMWLMPRMRPRPRSLWRRTSCEEALPLKRCSVSGARSRVERAASVIIFCS